VRVEALMRIVRKGCRHRRFSRDQSGAVAVLIGLLATVFFGTAALAVDLGTAWARKREVQKQVDISALSVGWMLPMTSSNRLDIAEKVADYFTNESNLVVGQGVVTGSQLVNGNTADGEVIFQNSDFTACSDDCPQMRVIAPASRVEFGLAGAIGVSHAMVQREATVRMTSELPPANKTLPFWLPTGCGYGQTEADTSQGGPAEPTPTPTGTATALPTADPEPFYPTPVGTHLLIGLAVTPVGYLGTVNISSYFVTGVGSEFKKVTLRAYPPTGTSFVDFAAETAGSGAVPTFTVSQEISAVPGDWRVYALAQKNNSLEYSATHLILRVADPVLPTPTPTSTDAPVTPDVAVGCVGQDRGNFGQLDSPRLEGGAKQERLARNLALGLDHTLVPYVFPTGQPEEKDCGDVGNLLPGAQLDDVSRPGNNCVTGDTGNDGPKIMDGLIYGISGVAPGRLDVVNGATTCPGRNNASVGGQTINNDVLSCFLRNGATLADISETSGVNSTMLDPSILDSPRLVWLPVVFATDRAQKNFQPIRHFVPGFITDETQTTVATSLNGLEINGNSVSVLNIFTFNRDALPTTETSDTTDYDPDVGGGIVRLVG